MFGDSHRLDLVINDIHKSQNCKSPAVFVIFCCSVSLNHYSLYNSKNFHNTPRRKEIRAILHDQGLENNLNESPHWFGGKRQTELPNVSWQVPVEFCKPRFYPLKTQP